MVETSRPVSHEYDYEQYCRQSPRRERAERAARKAQRLRDAQRPSQALVRARTPPHSGRASLELRHVIRTGGIPGFPGHPDTKPEMDPRQRARMNKIIGTMSASSLAAKEQAEAELAEAAAQREWIDVAEAEDELRQAKEIGDQNGIEIAQARVDAERQEAETAQRQADLERQEADAAAAAVASEHARQASMLRRPKRRLPGVPIVGLPGRPARWLKGQDLASYQAQKQSATQDMALTRLVNNDSSLTSLDWSKMDLNDAIAQRLGVALYGNTHLRRLDLSFNPSFTDLACSCGKQNAGGSSSLQRALAHTSVLRIELVGTGVSGRKAGALHAICLANAIDAVKCNDPTLQVLDWDAMRVDGAAIHELAKALRSNTNIRKLRLQHNRRLTDGELAALDDILMSPLCGITEVLCAVGTGVSVAKANALSQIIDLRRLRADDPSLKEIVWAMHESSDLEGLAKLRSEALLKDDGADDLLRQAAAMNAGGKILMNRRTCKVLGDALQGSTNLRVIDLGYNPQLNDTGAAFIVEGLSQSKVVRVWALQTAITSQMKHRMDRICVENALQLLGKDDPSLVALHWFHLHLTNQEILDCTCFVIMLHSAKVAKVANVLLTNTVLQLLELQHHEKLSPSCVQTLDDHIRRSAARGKPHKVVCNWRTESGAPCELQWWRDKGERSVLSASYSKASAAPLAGRPASPLRFVLPAEE